VSLLLRFWNLDMTLIETPTRWLPAERSAAAQTKLQSKSIRGMSEL
jgi:hypothetical protein